MKSSDPRAIAAKIVSLAKRKSKKKFLEARRVQVAVDRELVRKRDIAEMKRASRRRRINAKMVSNIRNQGMSRRPIASLKKKKKPHTELVFSQMSRRPIASLKKKKKPHTELVFSQSIQVGSFLWTEDLAEKRRLCLSRESQEAALNRTPTVSKRIVSLPRSGRVWIRSIFRMMGYEERIEFSHDGFFYEDAEEYQSDKRKYGESLVALLVRDPRDALVSMWHFCKFRVRFEFFQDMSLWDYTEGHGGMMSRVVNFLNDWADPNNLHQDTVVHIVRYEDMQNDVVLTFTLLMEFFSYEFGDLEWTKLITPEVVEQAYGVRSSKDHRARHCRRAEVGAWRDYYTIDQSVWLTERLKELDPVYGYK